MQKYNIGIIGGGSVGSAFGLLLRRKGYHITGITSQSAETSKRSANFVGCAIKPLIDIAQQSNVICITTPDRVIGDVANQLVLTKAISPGTIVLHASGAHTSDAIAEVRSCGAYACSLHPLQSCPTPERAVRNIPGSIFTIEGDEPALPTAQELALAMGGQIFSITKQHKPLYHAAACAASNYFVSTIRLSIELLVHAGISEEQALPALLPLIKGSFDNIEQNGVPDALTGPIARGDVSTIQTHLTAIDTLVPQLSSIYRALGIYTVDVATAKGSVTPSQAQTLKTALF